MFLHTGKTFKALNGFLYADVPLRNYPLTLHRQTSEQRQNM